MRDGFYILKEYGMEVMSKFREAFSFSGKDGGGCITTKELGVGIMILVCLHGTGVVLDGNSFKWKNSDQALKLSKNKEVRRCLVQKLRTRRYADQEVRTYTQVPRSGGAVPQIHSLQGKEARSRGVYHVWFVVFGPSIMILRFWPAVLFLYYYYY